MFLKIVYFITLGLIFSSICFSQNKTTFTYDVKGNIMKITFTGNNNCGNNLQNKVVVMAEQIKITNYETQLLVSPVPANSTITINYTIAHAGFTTIEVYDMLGNKLQDVFSGLAKAGIYTVQYPLQQLAQGSYLCILRTIDRVISTKFIKVK